MKVLMIIGPYSIFAHYRALVADGEASITWELIGGNRREKDGTRAEISAEGLVELQETFYEQISQAIGNHYTTPDDFAAWFNTQDLPVADGGLVTFEDAVALARAAYGAAHEVK